MKNINKKIRVGALPCIVMVLVLSGGLRLGGISLAIASETKADAIAPITQPAAAAEPSPDVKLLLAAIAERTATLDDREAELAKRAEDLNAARELIDQNLKKLTEAEERLANTIARVDGASESDIERLTAVYESMKPKTAAALFEQMTPEFAAGFLSRMNSESAAGILSGLSTDTGYAISVVLAGRNANAPKK